MPNAPFLAPVKIRQGFKMGESEKFEKLVWIASLMRYLRIVSTKREQIQGPAGK
jgi:hypothetical protein